MFLDLCTRIIAAPQMPFVVKRRLSRLEMNTDALVVHKTNACPLIIILQGQGQTLRLHQMVSILFFFKLWFNDFHNINHQWPQHPWLLRRCLPSSTLVCQCILDLFLYFCTFIPEVTSILPFKLLFCSTTF